jgi:hypothetical protein
MERIGTELGRRDRDGTGEWNGLALNWQGEIVMAPEDRTDVNPSRVTFADTCGLTDGRTNIKNVTGTFRDYAKAHKRSIKETVRENVNVNHLVECRERPVVFGRGFAHSTYNQQFAVLPRLQQLSKRYWN